MANFDKRTIKKYVVKKEGNGVYIFFLESIAKIGDQILDKRNALGLTETTSIKFETLENSKNTFYGSTYGDT